MITYNFLSVIKTFF